MAIAVVVGVAVGRWGRHAPTEIVLSAGVGAVLLAVLYQGSEFLAARRFRVGAALCVAYTIGFLVAVLGSFKVIFEGPVDERVLAAWGSGFLGPLVGLGVPRDARREGGISVSLHPGQPRRARDIILFSIVIGAAAALFRAALVGVPLITGNPSQRFEDLGSVGVLLAPLIVLLQAAALAIVHDISLGKRLNLPVPRLLLGLSLFLLTLSGGRRFLLVVVFALVVLLLSRQLRARYVALGLAALLLFGSIGAARTSDGLSNEMAWYDRATRGTVLQDRPPVQGLVEIYFPLRGAGEVVNETARSPDWPLPSALLSGVLAYVPGGQEPVEYGITRVVLRARTTELGPTALPLLGAALLDGGIPLAFVAYAFVALVSIRLARWDSQDPTGSLKAVYGWWLTMYLISFYGSSMTDPLNWMVLGYLAVIAMHRRRHVR